MEEFGRVMAYRKNPTACRDPNKGSWKEVGKCALLKARSRAMMGHHLIEELLGQCEGPNKAGAMETGTKPISRATQIMLRKIHIGNLFQFF